MYDILYKRLIWIVIDLEKKEIYYSIACLQAVKRELGHKAAVDIKEFSFSHSQKQRACIIFHWHKSHFYFLQ